MPSGPHAVASAKSRPAPLGWVRRNLVAGIIVLAPVALTLWVLQAGFNQFVAFIPPEVLVRLQPLVADLPDLPGLRAALGIAACVTLIAFIGALARSLVGRRLTRRGHAMIDRLPVVRSLYQTTRQLTETLLTRPDGVFRRVCLLPYPEQGRWALAFVPCETAPEILRRAPGDLVTVFMPTAPNPTTGILMLVPGGELTLLDMSFEQAMKIVISGGLVNPDDPALQPLAPADAAPPAADRV